MYSAVPFRCGTSKQVLWEWANFEIKNIPLKCYSTLQIKPTFFVSYGVTRYILFTGVPRCWRITTWNHCSKHHYAFKY